MKDYEVNSETLAIIAEDDNNSIIYEKDDVFRVNKSSNKIMEDSCRYFGSTLEGRQKGATALTGITHKVPIIIEETNGIVFFPTNSPRLKDCCWISLNNIKDYYKKGRYCKIKFINDKEIKLDISYGVCDNQFLRSTLLLAKLNERKYQKRTKKTKKIG